MMDKGTPGLGEIGLANYPPYLMNRIMGRYNAAIRAEMGKLGLTTPKMRALAVLSVMDGLLIGQLAVHAIVEQSTLSRAVNALEAEGLVRRVADTADSRAVRVFISDTGRAAFESLWPHMADTYLSMVAGIDPDELRAFVATLQKLHDNTTRIEV
ncbi:MAG: MarR family transcriptional regulator [Pseudorhodobacter sp.]|nr:MarR family transcriptional regulator [Pseudorhodobacter sp.]